MLFCTKCGDPTGEFSRFCINCERQRGESLKRSLQIAQQYETDAVLYETEPAEALVEETLP